MAFTSGPATMKSSERIRELEAEVAKLRACVENLERSVQLLSVRLSYPVIQPVYVPYPAPCPAPATIEPWRLRTWKVEERLPSQTARPVSYQS